MNCYIETRGTGPDIVLLHGWSLHGGVFDRVAAALATHYCVHCVDLPGHGASPAVDRFDPAAVADSLAAAFPLPVHLLGWSLGGLVAQHWAVRHPGSVKSLALVASSPRFVNAADWHCGVEASALHAVARQLDSDFERTLHNFLALQMMGASHARDTLRALSDGLFAHGRPQGLLPALDCLLGADARPLASSIVAPTVLFFGARDRITPPAAGRWLQQALPDATLHEFAQAAHTPFLTHEHDFTGLLARHLDLYA